MSLDSHDPNEPISFGRLSSEARRLSYLVTLCAADERHTSYGNRTFLYFVDSADVFAYLHPERPSSLNGYMLAAERAVHRAGRSSGLELACRTRSEQVLRNLLFEQDSPVVLLPSHCEELTDELSHIARTSYSQRIHALEDAQRELATIQGASLSDQMIREFALAAADGDVKARRTLTKFLVDSAPAVALILGMLPDTVGDRVDAIVGPSRLTTIEALDWRSVGVPDSVIPAIRALRPPSAESVERWSLTLRARRDNTLPANMHDAEAIAFLTSINELFERQEVPMQAILISRTTTLTDACERFHRDKNGAQTFRSCVRHTRLLPQNQTVVGTNPDLQNQREVASQRSLESLSAAITLYERQVWDTQSPDTALLLKHAQDLVAAWHKFEAARIVPGITDTTSPDDAKETGRFAKLLAWLRGEKGLNELLQDELARGRREFGKQVFSRFGDPANAIALRIQPTSNPAFALAYPCVDGLLGPFLLPMHEKVSSIGLTISRSSAGDLIYLTADQDPIRVSDAEAYFIWSLLHLERREIGLATIYADTSIVTARIAGKKALMREAQLLRNQLSRVAGDLGVRDADPSQSEGRKPTGGGQRASQEQWSHLIQGDLVRALERAARLLDIAILKTTASEQCVDHLASSIEQLKAIEAGQISDSSVRVRLATIGVTQCLLAKELERIGKTDFVITEEFRDEMTYMLREGIEQTHNQSSHTDREIPIQAVAADLLASSLSKSPASDASDAGSKFPSAQIVLSIPLNELKRRLLLSGDNISKLLQRSVEIHEAASDGGSGMALIYAPAWRPDDVAQRLALFTDPSLRDEVGLAIESIHRVGEENAVLRSDSSQAHQAVAKLLAAKSVLDKAWQNSGLSDSKAAFLIEMEQAYCDLLLWLGSEKEPDSPQRIAAVLGKYEGLAKRFPESAVVQYRISIACRALDRHQESLAAMQRAISLAPQDDSISSNQWIRTTMRRRMALHFGEEASAVRDLLLQRPGDQALRNQYLSALQTAFGLIYDRVAEGNASADGKQSLVEYNRSLNNVVFYAAAYLRAGGTIDKLHPGFSRDSLERFCRLLYPRGLQRVLDWEVLHTIGVAFEALEWHSHTGALADQLVALIQKQKISLGTKAVQEALTDAFAWQRNHEALKGRNTPPSRAGASS